MRRSPACLFVSLGLVSLAAPRSALADTLAVAAGGKYDTPCKAIAAAKAGDVIEIAAGTYTDACSVPKSLTIKGVGGRPVINAPASISNGKGIFAIQGNDTDVIIENLEIAGAKVSDENGAAIRAQGRALTVRNCVLRENENGVLGGEGGTITIEHSTFDRNGDGKGYAHNVYIGTAKKLVFRGNYSRASKIGHLLKSRAEENIVIANRLTGEDGTESYEADFPNGGRVVFAFNLVQQGTTTDNPHMLAYGMENLSSPVNELTVVHNTFVNGRGKGNEIFVNVKDGFTGNAAIVNNIFQGGGKITSYATAMLAGNLEGNGGLVDAAGFDFHLTPSSGAKDKGVDSKALLGDQPLLSYVHPAGDAPRTNVGAPDAGAYELGDTGAGGSGTGGSGTGGSGTGGSGTGGSGTAGKAGTGGTGPAGSGGASAAGTGGTSPGGTGGTVSGGAGGSSAGGSGGTSSGGAGGTATSGGASGSSAAGKGGSTAMAGGSGGSAGSKAAAGAAGTKAAAGASGTSAGGATNGAAPAASDEGCGCRLQPSEDTPAPAALALLALAATTLRRRGRKPG